MTITFIIIAGMIIWFIILWTLVISILSIISGWRKLSILYPDPLMPEDESSVKFSMCSLKLGFISYNSIVHITFTGYGIILRVMKIFSFMHKPIYISLMKKSPVWKKAEYFSPSPDSK